MNLRDDVAASQAHVVGYISGCRAVLIPDGVDYVVIVKKVVVGSGWGLRCCGCALNLER
jgi:hypothetical protein